MHKLPKSYITKTISFLRKIKPDDKKMLVYHGDADGCTAAALLSLGIKEKFGWDWDKVYWVGTDEYDFKDLKRNIYKVKPDYLIFLDLNVVTEGGDVLKDVIKKIKTKILIFDHHISSKIENKDIVFLNPTPDIDSNRRRPLPSCFFAYKVYKSLGKKNISWITGAGLIGEGMADKYKDFFPRIVSKFPNLITKDLNRSNLAKISSLIDANFIAKRKQNITFDLLMRSGEQEKPSLFFDIKNKNSKTLRDLRNSINKNISYFFRDTIKSAIEIDELDLFMSKVESKHRIESFVSNILKKKFPDKIIFLYSFHKDKVLIELKTDRDDINFNDLLKKVCKKVNCITAGGHPMAAGAMLYRKYLNSFLEKFKDELRRYIVT